MEDLSGKLSEILKDPHAMEQVRSLAGMLGLGGDSTPEASPAPVTQAPANPLGALGSLGGLGGLLGGSTASPELLQSVTKLLPLLSQFQQEDESTRFLRALRPLLGEERRRKLDESIRILQMLRLLPLLKSEGIL